MKRRASIFGTPHCPRTSCGAGYLVVDVLLGLALLGVLMMTMSVMVNRHQQASAGLADRRTAQRLAELAMLALQNPATSMPQGSEAMELSVRPVEGEPIGDRVWAQVTVVSGRHEVRLVGLVDAARLREAEGVR